MTANLALLLNEGIKELTKPKEEINIDKCDKIFDACFSYYYEDNPKQQLAINLYMAHTFYMKEKYGLSIYFYKKVLESEETMTVDNVQTCYNNIGCSYREISFTINNQSKEEKAIEAFEEAFKKNPLDDPMLLDCLINRGAISVGRGTPNRAIEVLNEALEIVEKFDRTKYDTETNAQIDKYVDQIYWNRGLANYELYNFEQANQDYEHGIRINDRNERSYNGLPNWDGTNGKTIIVYGEQGIGDELMWASIIPDIIKDNKVIIDCHPRLQELFRESFPEAVVYGTRKEKELYWCKYHNADARIAFGSLAKFYRNKLEDFPRVNYLLPDEKKVKKYRDKFAAMGNKKKVGISWRGGTRYTGELFRFIPLEYWKDIFECDVDFISLQYRPDAESDIERLKKEMPDFTLHHWRETIDDYDETAAMIKNLDLIISIPQSVIHLAGAIGVPTIQLAPVKAVWQIGMNGEDMPWYNCVKNIWQTENDKWDDVLIKAKAEICNL